MKKTIIASLFPDLETGLWRTKKPVYQEHFPPCSRLCPIAGDVREFIRLLRQGKIKQAWESRIADNPFPAVCGRVCDAFCERECSRALLERELPVNIRLLERFLGDWGLENNLTLPNISGNKYKERIAIIGSGPAGLSCAYHLARNGFQVKIFEKHHKLGGLMRWGIPPFRLAEGIVEQEIQRILSLGITDEDIITKCEIKKSKFRQICKEFAAVFVATGALEERSLDLSERKSSLIISAIEFLRKNRHETAKDLGRKVVVIGGGNTALDAARTAIRFESVDEVKILYRRSKEQMPATYEEMKETEEEGIEFVYLVAPVKDEEAAVFDGLKLKGIRCEKMKLGELDEGGRPRPVVIENSKFVVEADTIILALGQDPDYSLLPYYPDATSSEGCSLFAKEGIFFGGDFINQERFLAHAIASGKKSAAEIIRFLNRWEEGMFRFLPEIPLINKEQINLAYFEPDKRLEVGCRLGKERIKDFDDICADFPEISETQTEATRCFQCGFCIKCDNCFNFCPDVAVRKISEGYAIDPYFCKGCGICVEECPRSAMMTEEEDK